MKNNNENSNNNIDNIQTHHNTEKSTSKEIREQLKRLREETKDLFNYDLNRNLPESGHESSIND